MNKDHNTSAVDYCRSILLGFIVTKPLHYVMLVLSACLNLCMYAMTASCRIKNMTNATIFGVSLGNIFKLCFVCGTCMCVCECVFSFTF